MTVKRAYKRKFRPEGVEIRVPRPRELDQKVDLHIFLVLKLLVDALSMQPLLTRNDQQRRRLNASGNWGDTSRTVGPSYILMRDKPAMWRASCDRQDNSAKPSGL